MSQGEFDFTAPSAPPAPLHPEHRVRKTITHRGSRTRQQHVYIRLTESARREYNSCIGGFKHFLGPNATGALIFESFALPAMKNALKTLVETRKELIKEQTQSELQ